MKFVGVLRDVLNYLYEVARPLSCNLKGGYHINCPFGYVGRGRVRVVTHGLNLPRHGAETARRNAGFTHYLNIRTLLGALFKPPVLRVMVDYQEIEAGGCRPPQTPPG